MKEQPAALRLADAIDPLTRSGLDNLTCAAAADGLRRLHAKYELLRIAPMKYRRMEFNAQLQRENERLTAQRDALLAACKAYDQWADKTFCYDRELRPIRAKIRAAIAAAERETK